MASEDDVNYDDLKTLMSDDVRSAEKARDSALSKLKALNKATFTKITDNGTESGNAR